MVWQYELKFKNGQFLFSQDFFLGQINFLLIHSM